MHYLNLMSIEDYHHQVYVESFVFDRKSKTVTSAELVKINCAQGCDELIKLANNKSIIFTSTEAAEPFNEGGLFFSKVQGVILIGEQKFSSSLLFNIEEMGDEGIMFSGNVIIKNPESTIGKAEEVNIHVKGKQ